MQKRITILSLTLLLSLFSLAQTNYFIVKNTGDTLKGNAKIKAKDIVITFEDGSTTALHPDEVIYVNSSSSTGIVLHCQLRVYSDNIDVVSGGNFNNNRIADTLLVLKEMYTSPKMNLYYVQDKEKVPYYFYKRPADSMPVQLLVKYYMHYLEGAEIYRNKNGTQFQQQKSYVNQLQMLMQDCDKVRDVDYEELDYRSYSLIQLIKRYNKCK